ncbi:MAG: hypothetical protein ACYDEB_09745 [Dehalococcoidia bacterium]
MQRDTIQEYLTRRARRGDRMTYSSIVSTLPRVVVAPLAPGDRAVSRGSRALRVNTNPTEDFAAALRVLQRNNRLLQARFGLGWAEVASVVVAEARRRGFSTAAVARLLVAGLRRDGEGRPS